MDAKIHVSRLGGTATVPPSKSAAHRAVLCAALAEGTSHITNIEYSKDIRATLGAAAQLGAKITEEAHSVTIKGHGTAGGFVTVTRPVFCNESGSTLRFLIHQSVHKAPVRKHNLPFPAMLQVFLLS